MTPENKAKWLEALRSGKYEQITGAEAATGYAARYGGGVQEIEEP